MNLLKKRYAAFSALFVGVCIAAHAEVPTEIGDLTTDASFLWGVVKVLILGVVAFGVVIGFVQWAKKD